MRDKRKQSVDYDPFDNHSPVPSNEQHVINDYQAPNRNGTQSCAGSPCTLSESQKKSVHEVTDTICPAQQHSQSNYSMTADITPFARGSTTEHLLQLTKPSSHHLQEETRERVIRHSFKFHVDSIAMNLSFTEEEMECIEAGFLSMKQTDPKPPDLPPPPKGRNQIFHSETPFFQLTEMFDENNSTGEFTDFSSSQAFFTNHLDSMDSPVSTISQDVYQTQQQQQQQMMTTRLPHQQQPQQCFNMFSQHTTVPNFQQTAMAVPQNMHPPTRVKKKKHKQKRQVNLHQNGNSPNKPLYSPNNFSPENPWRFHSYDDGKSKKSNIMFYYFNPKT